MESDRTASSEPWLRIRNASVRKGERGGRTILHDISFELREGEHTAILGPNGSGKSSLLRLITQEYRALPRVKGEPAIEVFGRSRWDVFDLRRHLGIVSAELQRDFLETAAHGASRGLEVAISGFFASQAVFPHHEVTADMRSRAREALKTMKAQHLEGRLLREMSTGEQRRSLIARALVSNPRVLLLDEPTAGLDVVARHRFLQTIRELARAGKTVVLVTHRLEEVIPEVSRVLLLQEGRVFRDGRTAEILTSKNLAEAYDASLEVARLEDGYYSTRVRAQNRASLSR